MPSKVLIVGAVLLAAGVASSVAWQLDNRRDIDRAEIDHPFLPVGFPVSSVQMADAGVIPRW
jgi:hypothetical protein